MPSLEKARIYEITSGDDPTTIGDPTDVQFNPESLKIQLSNRIEGGRSTGRQVRQFVGASSNSFTLDLEFDTADEGSTEEPVSVLERTQVLEKFIQPKTEGDRAQEQPSKLRFHWGNLIIDGVVESIDLDFDHFAHNGYPLHAKVTLKMKEQKIEFQFTEREQGGADSGQRAAQALAGELPSQAAARLGLDPGDWRVLGLDLSLGLSLDAGIELNYQADFSASIGVGVQAGISAGIDVDLSAELGLSAGASVEAATHLANDPRPKKQVSSGLALARAGGISVATNQLATARTEAAARSALTSFSADPGPSTSTLLAIRSPSNSNFTAPRGQPSARTGGKPSGRAKPDPRATSFGFGVPLQNRRSPALQQQEVLRATTGGSDVVLNGNWRNPGKELADRVQTRRRPDKRCGCIGPCHH